MPRSTVRSCSASLPRMLRNPPRERGWFWASMPVPSRVLVPKPQPIAPMCIRATCQKACKPVTPGWQFSTLTVLPEVPSSWTYILDNMPGTEATRRRAKQPQSNSKQVAPLLARASLGLGDGYYGSVTFLLLVADVPVICCCALPRTGCSIARAPPKTGRRGAPKKDGARFACKDPATHGTPDAYWQGTNRDGQEVQVSVWHHLHFKKARDDRSKRDPYCAAQAAGHRARSHEPVGFCFVASSMPALSEVSDLYARRYSQEHGYRVDKQNLLWETPRLRTPDQFQHWTDLVACVRNQFYLARPVAEKVRQPWESKHRELTPQQTRRAMPRILAQLGTPARPPKLRGKSPGRTIGTVVKKAPRLQNHLQSERKYRCKCLNVNQL